MLCIILGFYEVRDIQIDLKTESWGEKSPFSSLELTMLLLVFFVLMLILEVILQIFSSSK